MNPFNHPLNTCLNKLCIYIYIYLIELFKHTCLILPPTKQWVMKQIDYRCWLEALYFWVDFFLFNWLMFVSQLRKKLMATHIYINILRDRCKHQIQILYLYIVIRISCNKYFQFVCVVHQCARRPTIRI